MDLGDLSSAPTHSYFQVAGITILYYDYLLTFSAEVSYIWPQPISLNILLFYLNRYIAFASKIIPLIILFSNIGYSEEVSCNSIIRVHVYLLFLNQVAIAAILTTRTVALYNNSRAAIFGILGSGIVMVGVSCWSLIGSYYVHVNGLAGCQSVMTWNTAIHHASAWEASALFDALIFVLTLVRTLKLRKTHSMANSLAGEGLLDILLRDGALYFAVMALANLANILTYYFASSLAKGLFSILSSCIAASLCSRLVLNLYEAATPDYAGSDSYPEPMTAVMLTTRIELGTHIDVDHIDPHR